MKWSYVLLVISNQYLIPTTAAPPKSPSTPEIINASESVAPHPLFVVAELGAVLLPGLHPHLLKIAIILLLEFLPETEHHLVLSGLVLHELLLLPPLELADIPAHAKTEEYLRHEYGQQD